MKKPISLILAALLSGMISLTSCYTDQSLARHFVRQTVQESPGVWFIGADYLFKQCNVPGDSSSDPCYMLASVNDSAILESYNSQFAMQLESYGYKVFTHDESDQFFTREGFGLIINIAQLEMEEVMELHTDSEVIDTLEYSESTPIRVLRLNSWIEVSMVDTTKARREVLYATDKITDLIEGNFTQHQFRGDVTYSYKLYEMKPSLLGRFVNSSGRGQAQQLFDTWMNRYIAKNGGGTEPAGVYTRTKVYYHYNPERNRIEPVDPSKELEKL